VNDGRPGDRGFDICRRPAGRVAYSRRSGEAHDHGDSDQVCSSAVVRSWLRGGRRRCHPWSLARLRGLLIAATLLLATARDARAERAGLSVHIVVDAPASCTDEEKFWAEVTQRTAEIHRVPAADDVPTLVVRAWQEEAGKARGELFLRSAREEMRAPRGVVARTCAEVTAALALALVLAMEEGELTNEQAPPPSPEPERSSPPGAKATSQQTSSGSRVEHDVERRRVATSMGAHAIVASVDGPALGVGIFSEIQPSQMEGRVSFRLEAAAWRRTVAREAGEADLLWLFLRARLCLSHTIGLSLAFCGLVDGGALTASATQARNPLSYAGPWAGAGLAAGATWTASRRLRIELEAGFLAPLVRDDLVLQPNAVLYSTPPLAMWVGIGPVFQF
jgi:hypothetical protein